LSKDVLVKQLLLHLQQFFILLGPFLMYHSLFRELLYFGVYTPVIVIAIFRIFWGAMLPISIAALIIFKLITFKLLQVVNFLFEYPVLVL
jgi:hypothetical protein